MNRNSSKKLIYVRYIFPVALIVLSFLLMLVPCYSYTTADTGAQAAISLCELLDNARVEVCKYIFETTGSRDAGTMAFSRTVLGLLIGFSVLFAVATAAAVYVLVSAIRYFKNPADRSTARILFITLFPNRIATFAVQALIFPLLAFPRIMVLLYENILQYHVTLSLSFPDPLILVCVLYVASIALSVVSASRETALGMNPFSRPKHSMTDDGEEE